METKIPRKVAAYLTFHRSPKRTQFGSRAITYASHALRFRKESIAPKKSFILSELICVIWVIGILTNVTSILARNHAVLNELLLEAKTMYTGAQAHLISVFVSET